MSEGRLPDISLAKSYFGRTSGAQFGFPDWRKNFTEEEIAAVVEAGHGKIYRHAGPSAMRALRVDLNGYEFCRGSEHPVLREQRSRLHEARCRSAYPMIKVSECFAPNENVRQKIQRIREDYHRLFGEPSIEQQLMSNYAMLKGSLYKMSTVLGLEPPAEPPLRRYEYDRRPRAETEMPYVAQYPHHDPKYEHAKSVYENEMKLMKRLVGLLEQDESPAEAEQTSRRIDEAFKNLESIGNMAKLIDDLGGEVGFTKAWLRSEKLKSLSGGGFDPATITTAEGRATVEPS